MTQLPNSTYQHRCLLTIAYCITILYDTSTIMNDSPMCSTYLEHLIKASVLLRIIDTMPLVSSARGHHHDDRHVHIRCSFYYTETPLLCQFRTTLSIHHKAAYLVGIADFFVLIPSILA